ncbi:hypothetical protein ABEB36_008433 [Hypothenemus hampei]|uniref:CCDC92/74 N-terminal domain-containing protein n=1 Tax=Hypothenemus hampei TaxID=57062 RepID=A0ABD1EMG0_HYPHA
MKQITYFKKQSVSEHRKIPLSTIVLPPISLPSLQDDDKSSDILEKIVNKSSTAMSNDVVLQKTLETHKNEEQKTPEQARLEQTVKCLQEQHQLMLTGLHEEIEKLKTRNRELQFQVIFGKLPVSSNSSSASSTSEDDPKHKLFTSPKVTANYTSIQVELLEKELGELRVQVQEQESRNLYLSAIVDEQKKQLERYDRRREKEQQRTNGSSEAEMELMQKLEDAQTMIRQLRRENSDLRKESVISGQNVAAPRSVHPQQNLRENTSFQYSRGHHHRGGNARDHRSHNNHYNNRGAWFPPLHTQQFWQGGRSHLDRCQEQATNLPEIAGMSENVPQHHHHQYHGRRNNNHRYNGDGRNKYRNGQNRGNKPS